MIKCNVTVCGTIGRNASARTNKEGNSFLSFPLRVTIPDRDGQNEVIEISVSKDGSQEEASGYRNGSHVEITGTLFLKRRGDKLYFNLFADRIDPVASDTADFLKGDMAFRGKVGKNIEERKDRNDKPYTMFSAFSIKKVDENFEYQWVRFFCFDRQREEWLQPGVKVAVMAGYRKRNTEGPSSEDKALDLFAEMMIEKIESIQKDWHKPWFTEGVLQWPRNLSGREYNGMNALMLLLHCENEGYKIHRFCTFDCVQRLNKPGKDGQELPRVSVLKGEKSFPVMLTTFTCIHKETKEKIKYDDYKKLSDEEKAQYNVYPKMQVFRVFNVARASVMVA